MADEKDKKSLGYKPDIKYTEDYTSSYKGGGLRSYTVDEEDDFADIYDDDYMQNIQDNIDKLVELIPNLSVDLQTVINQVFKPIFNDWYKNLSKKRYPSRIPDPDEPIIKKPVGEKYDPWDPHPPTWEEPDPDPNPDPTPGPGDNPWDPKPPIEDPYPNRDPEIFIPDIDDPIIEPPTHRPIITFPGDDFGIFDPGSPFEVVYEPIDPIEKIDLEYTKNMAELYYFYTDNLSSSIGNYFLGLCTATFLSGDWQDNNSTINKVDPNKFMLTELSMEDAKAPTDLKHLADTAVRYDINSYLKVSFVGNTFPLESTLYHMKNVKAAQEFRLRYEKEKAIGDGTQVSSTSDRILFAAREAYNKKYDAAYINLYKYLNSHINALDDALKAELTAITAKDTLIRKGGVDKK